MPTSKVFIALIVLLIGAMMMRVIPNDRPEKRLPLGIPKLVWEAVTHTLMYFSLGIWLGRSLWLLPIIAVTVSVVTIVAIKVDPCVWDMQDYTLKDPETYSLVGNIAMGVISLAAYLFGAWLT